MQARQFYTSRREAIVQQRALKSQELDIIRKRAEELEREILKLEGMIELTVADEQLAGKMEEEAKLAAAAQEAVPKPEGESSKVTPINKKE